MEDSTESIFNQKCGKCGEMKAGDSGICLDCLAKTSNTMMFHNMLTPEEQIQRANLCGPRIRLANPNDPNNKIKLVK